MIQVPEVPDRPGRDLVQEVLGQDQVAQGVALGRDGVGTKGLEV